MVLGLYLKPAAQEAPADGQASGVVPHPQGDDAGHP